MAALSDRFAEIEAVFEETEKALSDPEVLADPTQVAELGKRHSELKDVVADIRRWRQASVDLIEARELADDPDMAVMADDLEAEITALEGRIKAASRRESSSIRVLSPRMLPPLRGLLGSTASTATR